MSRTLKTEYSRPCTWTTLRKAESRQTRRNAEKNLARVAIIAHKHEAFTDEPNIHTLDWPTAFRRGTY